MLASSIKRWSVYLGGPGCTTTNDDKFSLHPSIAREEDDGYVHVVSCVSLMLLLFTPRPQEGKGHVLLIGGCRNAKAAFAKLGGCSADICAPTL
jgi:hypothetical protein